MRGKPTTGGLNRRTLSMKALVSQSGGRSYYWQVTSDKPRTMKVLVSQDNGFRVQEISQPLLNEGEILLQVTACGVCFSDVHKIRFQRMEDQVVLGIEVADRVV